MICMNMKLANRKIHNFIFQKKVSPLHFCLYEKIVPSLSNLVAFIVGGKMLISSQGCGEPPNFVPSLLRLSGVKKGTFSTPEYSGVYFYSR